MFPYACYQLTGKQHGGPLESTVMVNDKYVKNCQFTTYMFGYVMEI